MTLYYHGDGAGCLRPLVADRQYEGNSPSTLNSHQPVYTNERVQAARDGKSFRSSSDRDILTQKLSFAHFHVFHNTSFTFLVVNNALGLINRVNRNANDRSPSYLDES